MNDWLLIAAQKKHSLPDDWRWFRASSSDVPDGFIRLTGAVPIGTYRTGRNKGRTKWPKHSEWHVVFIRRDDIDACIAEWESETGCCGKCGGLGEETASVSVTDGRKTRQCRNYGGSGKARTVE